MRWRNRAGGAAALPFTPYTGLWWNPDESGTGYNLQVQHGVMVVTMFSYTSAGDPTWYYVPGRLAAAGTGVTMSSTLDRYRGGQCASCTYMHPTAAGKRRGVLDRVRLARLGHGDAARRAHDPHPAAALVATPSEAWGKAAPCLRAGWLVLAGKIGGVMAIDKPRAVAYFGAQFERQIASHDYKLNPFEERALPYLAGRVLDLGCGLGNLALAAAARGAHVTAYDACENAVDDLAKRAMASGLDIWVRAVDLKGWRPEETYDAVSCIGLLMFFAREDALAGVAGGPRCGAARRSGDRERDDRGIDLRRDVRSRRALPLPARGARRRPSRAGKSCTTASRTSPWPGTR